MPSSVIAAIDFGTSNSTVGVMAGNKPILLPLHGGKPTAPTALFFPHGKTSGSALHGNEAIDAYRGDDPGRFMRGLKSVLGTSLFDESMQLGLQTVTFKEILAAYIGWLLRHAATHHG